MLKRFKNIAPFNNLIKVVQKINSNRHCEDDEGGRGNLVNSDTQILASPDSATHYPDRVQKTLSGLAAFCTSSILKSLFMIRSIIRYMLRSRVSAMRGTYSSQCSPLNSLKGTARRLHAFKLLSRVYNTWISSHMVTCPQTIRNQKSPLGDLGVNNPTSRSTKPFRFTTGFLNLNLNLNLILTLTLILNLNLNAQIYPISTQTTVTPPYPFTLDGFQNEGANKINLQLIINDVSISEYPVKLRLVLRNNSMRIYTNPAFAQQPTYVNGGEVITLDAFDLTRYFELQNLVFEGFSKNQYQQMGQLPEGIYQVYFEVLDYYRNYVISSSLMSAMLWVYLNEPPKLNLPLNENEVTINGPQNIMFNWSAQHSPFTRPGFMPEYVFEMWEIYPENLDPYQVTRSTRPIFTQTVQQTSLFYTIAEPDLIPGRKYAWRVRATDPEGIARFKDDGYSEVHWFAYGRQCDPPVLQELVAGKDFIESNWEMPQRMEQFTIQYKPVNSSNDVWYTETTTSLGHKIQPLKSNTEYMVEVSGSCGTQSSEFSNRETIRTTQNLDYSCGAGNTLSVPENRDPIPYLKRGDVIRAGDFDVEIAEVTGSNGIFSGKAYMLVPFFSFIKIITEFDNIEVNTDFELVSGEFVTMYDLNNALIASIGGGGFGSSSSSSEETNNFLDSATVKREITDSIASVSISGNSVIIEMADGSTETVSMGANDVVAITASNGNDYIVDNSTNTVYVQGGNGGQGPSGGSSSVSSPSSASQAEYTVSFKPGPTKMYGFDEYTDMRPASNYKQANIAGTQTYLPWKSTEAGRIDKMIANIEGTPIDSVYFSRESANMVMVAPGTRDNNKQLMITGLGHEDEDELYAWYTQTTEVNDTTTNTENYMAGKLSLVSYERQLLNVWLVSVNGSACPNENEVKSYLDTVYTPAIVQWNVRTLQNGLNVELPIAKTIDNTDNDDRMDYTREMKDVIKEMKDHELFDNNDLYIFCFDASKEAGAMGYMPFKNRYGFIYKNSQTTQQQIHTIAHELGHGPFRLRHTFSSENNYQQNPGASDNIMDYDEVAGGTNASLEKNKLYKYQWDLIHNPEAMLFAFLEDEEEGESVLIEMEAGIKQELEETIEELKASPSIFDKVYSVLLPEYRTLTNLEIPVPNFFKIRLMEKDDPNYYQQGSGTVTAGYFNSSEGYIEYDVFPDFIVHKIEIPGSEESPHEIVFHPYFESPNIIITGQYNNLSTVFEEFFHAAQHIYYQDGDRGQYEIEVEAKLAKAFEIYQKGWENTYFKSITIKEMPELGFLKTTAITNYFDKLINHSPISEDDERTFRNSIVNIAGGGIYDLYKHKVPYTEKASYKGRTNYFDSLTK